MGALCGKCTDAPPAATSASITLPAQTVVEPATDALFEQRNAIADKGPSLLSDISEPPTAGSQPEGPDLELAAATLDKHFSFAGTRVECKVVDVYDGDTVTVVFRFRDVLTQWKLRLHGYDSPEMKQPKSKPEDVRKAAKSAAIAARDALALLVLNKVMDAHLGGFDKYGRILADLFPTAAPEGVTAYMLRNGYGVAYYGGKKEAESV